MFAIDIFVLFNDRIVKVINDRDELNNFDFATQRVLKTQKRVLTKQLTLIIKRREFFEKKKRFRKINVVITILKTRFATFKIMSFRESMMKTSEKNQNVMNDVQNIAHNIDEQIAYRRRAVKSKKISLYHDKNIKKHIDYCRNCATTFRLTSENYSTNDFKIAYVMQYLIENSKNS